MRAGSVLRFLVSGWWISACMILLGSGQSFAQQRVQFTQYMFDGLVINPAYAGADEALSLTFIQRNQWAGVENAPTTQTLSAHTLFKRKHFGLGGTLINDEIGVHRNFSAVTNYAYHLQVSRTAWLSMGVLAGVHSRKSDYLSLIGEDNNDPKLYNPLIAHTFFDFGAGLYFRSPRIDIGLSAPQLLPANYAINDTLSIRLGSANYFLFTRFRARLSQSVDLQPGFLIKYLTNVPLSYDINLNFIFHRVLTTGVSYRRKESVDFLLKGQISPQLQFGYAYDYPLKDLARLSNGSHEIMIQYLFRYRRSNIASPR